MSRTQIIKSRVGTTVAALAATAAAAALLASPAAAANGSGEATIKPADHTKGRTLSGQGVEIVAGAGASTAGATLSLPIAALDAGGTSPWAQSPAALAFKHGKHSLALTGISFDLGKGTLSGSLGGKQLAVFQLGGAAAVDAGAGSVALSKGQLRLTAASARLLKNRLGLERTLIRRGVGQVWLSAKVAATTGAAETNPPASQPASPIDPPSPRPVTSGEVGWGFLASWRSYVLTSPPAGSAEVTDGATATGELSSPATTYGFPAIGGSYLAASGGTPAELTLTTEGSVDWAKPGHGINEVRLSNLEIEFGPSGSWLIADVSTDFGVQEGTEDVRFASLDPSAVTATESANSVTWTGVPATLTAEGASSFAGFYEAGKQLEPVNLTVGLG